MNIFDRMLSNYQITTNEDYTNAVHEIMQQISLGGLYRGNFFDKAAFYGGTCLRIFHGLNRFSEDMDFSLLLPDTTFSLEFDSAANKPLMVSIYFVILTPPVLLYPLTVQKKPFFKTVFQPAGKYVPGAWEICSSRLGNMFQPAGTLLYPRPILFQA